MMHNPFEISRRTLLGTTLAATATAPFSFSARAQAQQASRLVIAAPADVQSWDAIAHLHSNGMPIYRSVFDSPLTQSPDMVLEPNVITDWAWSEDGRTLELTFRDDVSFHNGDPLTAEDFRFSFIERPREDPKLAIAGVYAGRLSDVEVVSPTRALMIFGKPMPTAPQWLAFVGNFILPKKYFESVGREAFLEKPVGSGPYKVVDYQRGSRVTLEAFEDYWKAKPKSDQVIFEIMKDPSARTAAIQSGQVDIAENIPTREVERLDSSPGLSGDIGLSDRVFLIHMMNKGVFQDQNVRLAAHHAIDKQAISNAFMAGKGKPVNVPGSTTMPGYPSGIEFAYSPERARELLAASGYGPSNPAKLTLFSTNGVYPSDWDIARAVVGMWAQVGIQADLQPVEVAKFFELNAAGMLPEGTLWSWANATNDPELYIGYLLDPDGRFSVWKSEDMRERIAPLLVETDYEKRIAGYRTLSEYVLEKGYTIPIVQAVNGMVHKSDLSFPWFQNGWFEPYQVERT